MFKKEIKIIRRPEDGNTGWGEGTSSIITNGNLLYEVKATFEFHSFLETAWNNALKLAGSRRRPLHSFVLQHEDDGFNTGAEVLEFLLKTIILNWFKRDDSLAKDLQKDLLNWQIVYLAGLCIGGGTFGKKYLRRRADFLKMIDEDKTSLEQIDQPAIWAPASLSGNSFLLQ